MPWGSGGVRSWGPSCHPAGQVLRWGGFSTAGRGCCRAGALLLVTVPAIHTQVPQFVARRVVGTEASCYPSRPRWSECGGGTGVTAIPAVRAPQAPHCSTQEIQQPTGHAQPPACLEMILAKSRALPGCQLLVGSVDTSSSNYHLFKPSRKKQTALQGRKCPKSLSSGRNVCSQQVSRPSTCLGLNKSLREFLAIAKHGARLAGTSGAWRQLGCGFVDCSGVCRDGSPERCRDPAAVQQLQLQPPWGSDTGPTPWRVSALQPC